MIYIFFPFFSGFVHLAANDAGSFGSMRTKPTGPYAVKNECIRDCRVLTLVVVLKMLLSHTARIGLTYNRNDDEEIKAYLE